MATFFLVSNPPSHPFTFVSPPPSFRPPSFSISPDLRFPSGDNFRRRKPRSTTVTTRAGPSTNSYVFAFALPLSLLAITVFTSIRISDKLDRDFLEEMAKNEAIMEVNEDDSDEDDSDDDDEDVETYLQEEPALPRARNRPKREA